MNDKNEQHGIPFSAFVLSLSTMALAALGQCDDPAFASIPQDPEIARNNIDDVTRKNKGEFDRRRGKIDPNRRLRFTDALRPCNAEITPHILAS